MDVDRAVQDEINGEIERLQKVCQNAEKLVVGVIRTAAAVADTAVVDEKFEDLGWGDEDEEEDDDNDEGDGQAVAGLDDRLVDGVEAAHAARDAQLADEAEVAVDQHDKRNEVTDD